MIRSIHPFPARMAPDLALERLVKLPPASTVLDPMAGSGTVLKQAAALGHFAKGFDVDPLAVMMARAWVSPLDATLLDKRSAEIMVIAQEDDDVDLPWIDGDQETSDFIDYWFAQDQKAQLRRFAFGLAKLRQQIDGAADQAISDVLHIALSRTIITKEQAASLARDTSHSRPHRVSETSSYDVCDGFSRSLKEVRKRLGQSATSLSCEIGLGDARRLGSVEAGSIDAVMTSPPYLNAIDYMRGHRLALVWMGHKLSDLRSIRSASIGTERGIEAAQQAELVDQVALAMGKLGELPSRFSGMSKRYARDLIDICGETARVLKPGGTATFVIGNSCLKGIFISNADGLASAAHSMGLLEQERIDRELPTRSRYLPVTGAALEKRMKTETVFTFQKPKSA